MDRRIADATWWTAVFSALNRFSDAHIGSLVIITAEGDSLNEDDHFDSFKTSQWAMVSPRDSVLARNHSAKNVRLLGLCVRCQSHQTNLKASEKAITNEAEQSFHEASTRNSSVPAEGTVFSVGQDQKRSGRQPVGSRKFERQHDRIASHILQIFKTFHTPSRF